ncbi:MAG: Gx transporter family protein [Calditrichia bacterium]
MKPLPDNALPRREAHLAALVVLGLILFLFEAFIPKPLPWLKLGLSNIVTLIALYWYGPLSALMVSLIRILLGSLFTGTFLSPAFFLSLSGGLLAVLAMILLFRLNWFGIWGVSMGGAAAHQAGQVLTAWLFLFRNPLVLNLLAYLVLYSLISGTLIGWLGFLIINRLKKEFNF